MSPSESELEAEKAASAAFGVAFASFTPVHQGNSSENYSAVAADGRRYFVKVARAAAVRKLVEQMRGISSPLVPALAFGGAVGSLEGGKRLVCAFEWAAEGVSVAPWELTEAQLGAIVEGYREFSRALGGKIHGDFHYKNFFLKDNRLVACFDLEKMRDGLPTEDLLRIFAHALERTRFWRRGRIAAIMRNFTSLVAISGYSCYDWLEAVERYECHKLERRKAKARSPLLAGIEEALRSSLYCSLRSAIAKATNAYWEGVGYRFVGPLLVEFSRWLKDAAEAAGVRRLYFLARDGEVMMKVFTALYPESVESCRYLLGSRRLCNNEACREDFAAYLRAQGVGEDGCAIVDVGRNGTVPRAFAELLGRKAVTTFYIDQRVSDDSIHGFFRLGHLPKRKRRVLDALDFLLISSSSLTVAVRRQGDGFVTETLPDAPEELVRQEIAKGLQAGAVEFAMRAKLRLDTMAPPSPQAAFAALCRLRSLLREDRTALYDVTVPFGKMNEKRRYLIAPAWPVARRLRHPLAFFLAWRKRLFKFPLATKPRI